MIRKGSVEMDMKQLGQYKERNLFLRGMVPLIGYKTATVTYARKERLAGESKYPLKKMLSFAWDGITSCLLNDCIYLHAGIILYGTCQPGMVFTDDFHLVFGWSAVVIYRSCRTICRENIYRK